MGGAGQPATLPAGGKLRLAGNRDAEVAGWVEVSGSLARSLHVHVPGPRHLGEV